MNLREAITRADALRPNAIDEEQKAAWCFEVEGMVAEVIGAQSPKNCFPEDTVLLMPSPHENIYPLYIAAMIDYYHAESTLYQNDLTLFNSAFSDARAWWIREHRPKRNPNWSVMV